MHDDLPLLLQQARRFGSTQLDAATIDADKSIAPALLSRAAEIGFFGLSVPEEFGGLGLDLGDTSTVVSELARFDRSVAVTIGLHCGLGTQPLNEVGSPTLREHWLPRLASGDAIASFCATEPSAGSDLTRIRTRAELVGDELVVDGEKSYVTNGGFAGVFTVLARTPGLGGARALSLLLVPRDLPGVVIGPEENKLGIRGSSTVTVRFDGVRIPLENVLGVPGGGLDGAHRALDWGRTLMSAGCIGTARAALEATRHHVESRRQFGRTLDRHGGVQEHLAFMASRLFAMESLVQRAGDLERRDDPGLASAAVMAKVFCSEGAFDICDRAIQLHGALGFIEDTGVALLARDCRVTRIFEGSNDVLVLHLGVGLVTSTAPVTETITGRGLESRMAESVRAIRALHGISIVRHPHAASRLARAHICLVAARAAVERAQRDGGGRAAFLLAEHAARELATEASLHLASLGHATQDADRDREIVEVLYGAPSERREIRQPTRLRP